MRLLLYGVAASAAIVLAFTAGAETLPVNAHLSGRDEVPPSTAHGAGELRGEVDTDTKLFTYRVTYKGLSGPATAARIYGPARRGRVGSPVLDVADPSSPISGEATLTDDQLTQLHKGLWYVNVATAANPDGEIRGQLREANPELENPSQPPSIDQAPQPASLSAR